MEIWKGKEAQGAREEADRGQAASTLLPAASDAQCSHNPSGRGGGRAGRLGIGEGEVDGRQGHAPQP